MSNYSYSAANDFLDISNLSGGLYNNSSNNTNTNNNVNNYNNNINLNNSISGTNSGASFEGGLQGYGRPHDSEDQLLFRLPSHLADKVRKMIKQKQMDMPIDFQFKNERQIIFKFGDESYNANLVDLPCIVESHKTNDKSNYYKTADIGQMIIVNDKEQNELDSLDELDNNNNNNNNNNANTSNKEKQKRDNTLPPPNVQNNMLTSGLTPASKDIVKRKFRIYNREKITELAKIEEELVRIIKPGYAESEDIEFVSLPDLKDKYGNDLFNINSAEPVIFEEKADDHIMIDEMDSNDESGLEDEGIDPIRTIKVKNMGVNNNGKRNFDHDIDFSDEERYTSRSSKPISAADRSPLEKDRSPSSSSSSRRSGRDGRSSRGSGDKSSRGSGSDRSFGSSFVNMNNSQSSTPNTPSIGINTSSNSIGAMSSRDSTPTSLKIKFPIPSSPSIESLNSIRSQTPQQPQTPQQNDIDQLSKSINSSSNSILSPSQKSPTSPRSHHGSDEKKKHRSDRHRSEGEHKRRKKDRSERGERGERGERSERSERSSSSSEVKTPGMETPLTSPQQPTLVQLDANIQDITFGNAISSPQISFTNEPTTPQQPQLNISTTNTPPLTSSTTNNTTTTTTNNKTTSPLNVASSSIQPISSISINNDEIIPNTPPISLSSTSVNTPPISLSSTSVSTPPTIQQSNTVSTPPTTNNDSELLNLISSLRKLQQESESLKRQLTQLQNSLNNAPNKILRERQQVKLDDATKQLNSKLKEIENVENLIQEIKNK